MNNNDLVINEIRQMLNMMGIDNKTISVVETRIKEKKKLLLEETLYQKLVRLLTPGNPGNFVRRLSGIGRTNILDFFGEQIDDVEYNTIINAIRNQDLNSLSDDLVRKLAKGMKGKDEFKEILQELYKDELELLSQAGISEVALLRKIKNQMDADPNLDFQDAYYLAVNGGQRKFLYHGLVDNAEQRFINWKKTLNKGSTSKFEPITIPKRKIPKEILIPGKEEAESIGMFQEWLNKTYPGLWNRTSDGFVVDISKNTDGFGEWSKLTKAAWDSPNVKKRYIAEMKAQKIGNTLYETEAEIKEFKKWLYNSGKITKEEYDEMAAESVEGIKTEKSDQLWGQHKSEYHKQKGYYANIRLAARKVSKEEILNNSWLFKIYKFMGRFIKPATTRTKILGIIRPMLFVTYKSIGSMFKGAQASWDEIIEDAMYAIRQNSTDYTSFKDAADKIAQSILALRRSEKVMMKNLVDDLRGVLTKEFPDDAEGIKKFFDYLQSEEAGGSYFASFLNDTAETGGLWGFMGATSIGRDLKNFGKIINVSRANGTSPWGLLALEAVITLGKRVIMFGLTGRFKTFKEYFEELMKEGIINTIKIGKTNTYIPNPTRGFLGILLWAGVMNYIFVPFVTGFAINSKKAVDGMVSELSKEEQGAGDIIENSKEYIAKYNRETWEKAVDYFENGETAKALYKISPFKIKAKELYDWINGGLNNQIYEENLNKLKDLFKEDMINTQKFTDEEINSMWSDIIATKEFTTIGEFSDMFKKLKEKYNLDRFKDTVEGFEKYLEYHQLKIGTADDTPDKKAYYKDAGGTTGIDNLGHTHIYDSDLGRWIPKNDVSVTKQRWKDIYSKWYPQNIAEAEKLYKEKEWAKAKSYYKRALLNLVPFSENIEELKDIEKKKSDINQWITNCDHMGYIKEALRYIKDKNKSYAINSFRVALRNPLKKYENGVWTVDQEQINLINKKIAALQK